MKALTYTLPLLLSIALLGGCSQSQYAQQEYDDMYYTAQDRQRAIEEQQIRDEARRQAQLEQQRLFEAEEAERRKNAYDKSDAQSARELNPDAAAGGYADEYSDEYYEEDAYYDENQAAPRVSRGQGNVTNNYYYGGAATYDPRMYDPYWNSMASGWNRPGWAMGGPGWGSGFSINIGMGWNSWGSWCDPFWDPWCGSSMGYYNAYRPAWAWNGWGYHNSYARGYQNGFYDGYYGRRNYWGSYYPSTIIVYNNNEGGPNRNVTYGPRSTRSMAGADMGVGSRSASPQQVQNYNRQRISGSDSRGTAMPGERQRQRSVRPASDDRTSSPNEPRTRTRTRSTETNSPRTQPTRSNDRTRPTREPAERSRPVPVERSRPAIRPTPSNDGGSRPSAPSRDRDGGSTPTRSRSRGGDSSALLNDFDSNNTSRSSASRTAEPAAPASTSRGYQPQAEQAREEAVESRVRVRSNAAAPAREMQVEQPSYSHPERREEPARERSTTYERPQQERQYDRPMPAERSQSTNSYSRPAEQPQRTYNAPAPQERSRPAYTSPAPQPRSERPAPSYNSPAPSYSAPAISNGSNSRSSSPASSSSPTRSGSSTRSRGGN